MVKFESQLSAQFDSEENGNASVGTDITVFKHGTTLKAELFNDDGIVINNPVTTGERGAFAFNLIAGAYDFVVNHGLDTEYFLREKYEISVNAENSDTIELTGLTGKTISLPGISSAIDLEIDGRGIPPSYYNFDSPSDVIELKTLSLSPENIVVIRFKFLSDDFETQLKTPYDFGASENLNDNSGALESFFNYGYGYIPKNSSFKFKRKITISNIDNFYIFGSGKLLPEVKDEPCLIFENCNDGRFLGVEIDASGSDASETKYSNLIEIRSNGFDFSHNKVLNAPVQAIASFSNNVKTDHNKIINPGAKGVVLSSGRRAGGAITHANCSNGSIRANTIDGGIANLIFVNATNILTPCNNVNVLYNRISNNTTNSIRLQPEDAELGSVKNCTVIGNIIFNCSRDAIRINGIGHTVSYNSCDSDDSVLDLTNNLINSNFSKDCVFIGNKAKKAGSCINFSYTQEAPYEMGNHIITENSAEECNYFCAAFSGRKNTNLTFSNNKSKNCVKAFYDLRDTENVSITNDNHDTLTQNFASGINFRRGKSLNVSSNTLSRSTDSPIIFRDCEDAKANSNTINDLPRTGIVFAGTNRGQATGNTVNNYGSEVASNGVLLTINTEDENKPSSNIIVNDNVFSPADNTSNGVGYQSCRDIIVKNNIGDGVNVIVSQIDSSSSFSPNNTDIIIRDNMENGSLSDFKSSGVLKQAGNYTMTGTDEVLTVSAFNVDKSIINASGSTLATDGASAALRYRPNGVSGIRFIRGADTATMSIDWQILEVL